MILICTIDELHAASSLEAVSRSNRIARDSNFRHHVVLWAIQNALDFHSDFRLNV
jgi:hypothetical protein